MSASDSPHDRQRSILGLGALSLLGLVVAACVGTASSSPSSIGTTSIPALPSTVSTAAASSSATSAPPMSSASPAMDSCTSADVLATAGQLSGAAGSRGADVVIRTSGNASCLLPASASVVLVDAVGTVLLSSQPAPTGEGPLLAPGGSVSFSVLMSNWCDQSVTLPLHLALVLAGGSADVGGLSLTAGDLPPCNGPGEPASLSTMAWRQP